ncbi:hypothetical protein [Endozoicomonas ascidiicola]|uniref:hypothetical protein n=1 Tax=Endozoicomonas ascidiicola TaxID=1698521 RepID=UPI000836C956|nr:hypothetical protein [Endozoicomonas ascidiicola]
MTSSKQPFTNGDQVTTDFFPKEKDTLRKVVRCYRSIATESGWLVDTEDTKGKILKSLDANWFKSTPTA